jgi:hypothetical protein
MDLKNDYTTLTIEAYKLAARIPTPTMTEGDKKEFVSEFSQKVEAYCTEYVKQIRVEVLKQIELAAKQATHKQVLESIEGEMYRLKAHPRISKIKKGLIPKYNNPFVWVLNEMPAAPESLKNLGGFACKAYLENGFWIDKNNKIQEDDPATALRAFLDFAFPVIKLDAEITALADFEKKPDWEFQELNRIEQEQPTKQAQKLTAKHYALAYLFDCDAAGRQKAEQKVLETVTYKEYGFKKSGVTFRKQVNGYWVKFDRNSLRQLEENGGENWRDIVLSLSKDRETLQNYLKAKHL